MYSADGAKKIFVKLHEGHSPIRSDYHYDLILKKELLLADMDNDLDIHGCYCYPPFGGYATHWSGCDNSRGVIVCPWDSSPHRQSGCFKRPGSHDAVRELYSLTPKGWPGYVSKTGTSCKVDPFDSKWHWKTLQPSASSSGNATSSSYVWIMHW